MTAPLCIFHCIIWGDGYFENYKLHLLLSWTQAHGGTSPSVAYDTLSAIFQYCKSQVITNFITICGPLYFRWNQSCGDLSDKSDDGIAIYITFMTLAMQWWQRNLPKSLLHVQSFCFALFIFSFPCLLWLHWAC